MTAPAERHERSTVAAGYDGSEPAKEAVRWAAEYAAAGHYRLRVVHAWIWPLFTRKLGPVAGLEGSGLRNAARSILADGVELARAAAADRTPAAATGPDVEGRMEAGHPAPVLRSAARDARLLVVGSRGLGGVLGPLAGSVCLNLAAASPCPLLVVRRPRGAGGPAAPVVVGIDGTSRSSGALAGAAELAGWLETSLRIVHVDQNRGGTRASHGRHSPLRGQELLDHAREEARSHAPQLSISVDLRDGHAASKELLAAASDAQVLVIGTHNKKEDGPGNTVTAVLAKARCNVLITR